MHNKKIKKLKNKIKKLKENIAFQNSIKKSFDNSLKIDSDNIPKNSNSSQKIYNTIKNNILLDFKPQLNTSSYVNVNLEEDEQKIALMGLKINLADQTVYPQSYKVHNKVVEMIARLWNCPKPLNSEYAGAATVGSTEACLLAGLAFKFRWRKWYADNHEVEYSDTLKIRPNMVISSCYQAAWEKLAKYMDIDLNIITPSSSTFTLNPDDVANAINAQTIGVVCIMGNHYGGQYDSVSEITEFVERVNAAKNYRVGIHVDAASGGFIAPFQKEVGEWDFRLKNVLSISSSGHKYGQSCCGTGWIVWREKENLSEHVATSVTYLGGEADSYTLNFSRPASGVYLQYFKLLHYGIQGYEYCCKSMMKHADIIRKNLAKMQYKGKSRFVFLDNGNKNCLPVVTAMLNPECEFSYNDIDLQNALAQHLWYVSAYKMSFEHPNTKDLLPLFNDQKIDKTMFRIVVKSNINESMVEHLVGSFEKSLDFLDHIQEGLNIKNIRHTYHKFSNHC